MINHVYFNDAIMITSIPYPHFYGITQYLKEMYIFYVRTV